MFPERGILGGIHAPRLERVVRRARELAHRDAVLLHLCTKRFDGLVRRRLQGVVDLDLQNKLGSATKIQAQPDLLLQTLHAGRNARKQDDGKDCDCQE